MDWIEYHRRHLDLVAALSEVRIVVAAAAIALKNFPANLPSQLGSSVAADFWRIAEALRATAEDVRPGATVPVERRLSVTGVGGGALSLFVPKVLQAAGAGPPDFAPGLARVQLVMTIAHLDAFLTDSLRAALVQKPEALSRGKQIEWKTIVDLGSWEAVLDHLREQYCFEFGVKPLDQRLAFLRNVIGLDVVVPPDTIESLCYSEQVRHMVLHNSGCTSPEFLRKTATRPQELRLGQAIELKLEGVEATLEQAIALATALFRAVSIKFFGTDPEGRTEVSPELAGNDGG